MEKLENSAASRRWDVPVSLPHLDRSTRNRSIPMRVTQQAKSMGRRGSGRQRADIRDELTATHSALAIVHFVDGFGHSQQRRHRPDAPFRAAHLSRSPAASTRPSCALPSHTGRAGPLERGIACAAGGPAFLLLELKSPRSKRTNPTATVPNLDRKFANKGLALRKRLLVVAAFQNGRDSENLAPLIDLIKSVIGHHRTHCPCADRVQE